MDMQGGRILTKEPIEVVFEAPRLVRFIVGRGIWSSRASHGVTLAHQLLRLWTTENGDFVQEFRVGMSFCSPKDKYGTRSKIARTLAKDRLMNKGYIVRVRPGWCLVQAVFDNLQRDVMNGRITKEQIMAMGVPYVVAKDVFVLNEHGLRFHTFAW